jgi:tRNA(Ile)-lysidine synthase
MLAQLRPQLPYPVRAIHVHHGLQEGADGWQAHCESICAKYEIPLVSLNLGLSPRKGDSLEALAREARYEALAKQLSSGDLLLTAQHQDDQAETLLLQLLRGSGPAGLAAMPLVTRFGSGWLIRPLLHESRSTLENYARSQGLDWREDPSNMDLRFDRNFIRHRVIPLLQSRWPAATMTLARAARFSGELLTLAREDAEEALARVRCAGSEALSVTALKQMPSVRLRHLLRHWIATHGAPMPNAKKLMRIEREAVHGRDDSTPLVVWLGWEVRRYRDELILAPSRPNETLPDRLHWVDKQSLELPSGLGSLAVSSAEGGIDKHYWYAAEIEVRFRQGGERCRPAGRNHHRPLKKLLQEWGVPPWDRDRLPLIYLDGELAAVPGRLVCDPFAAIKGEEGIQVHWHRRMGKGTQ